MTEEKKDAIFDDGKINKLKYTNDQHRYEIKINKNKTNFFKIMP